MRTIRVRAHVRHLRGGKKTKVGAHARKRTHNRTSADGYATWADVMADAREKGVGARLYYKAPMDFASRPVVIKRIFKNKLRVDPMNRDADAFTIDHHHLDRMRRT